MDNPPNVDQATQPIPVEAPMVETTPETPPEAPKPTPELPDEFAQLVAQAEAPKKLEIKDNVAQADQLLAEAGRFFFRQEDPRMMVAVVAKQCSNTELGLEFKRDSLASFTNLSETEAKTDDKDKARIKRLQEGLQKFNLTKPEGEDPLVKFLTEFNQKRPQSAVPEEIASPAALIELAAQNEALRFEMRQAMGVDMSKLTKPKEYLQALQLKVQKGHNEKMQKLIAPFRGNLKPDFNPMKLASPLLLLGMGSATMFIQGMNSGGETKQGAH